LPPHQRYTRVKDGKFQGGHSQQSDAMECFDCRKAKESTQLAQKEFCFQKATMTIKRRKLQPSFRLDISLALKQKTANFKMAFSSRQMQWSLLTVKKKRINLLHANNETN
jgi:hypothetical protein